MSKDGDRHTLKSTSEGKPGEIASKKIPLKPMPLVEPKVTNLMPDILEVKFKPSSCSDTIACAYIGGSVNFDVNFKLYRENYEGHLIKIGLKRGKIQLNLKPLSAGGIEPEIIIPPTIKITKEVKNSRGAKLSIKEPFLLKGSSKGKVLDETFAPISTGGSPEKPHFYFESVGGQPFEGTAKGLLCRINPAHNICCKCEYEFVVERGDWSFELGIDPRLVRGNRYFTWLKMRELAFRRIILLDYNAEQFNFVLSKGNWTCPAKKKRVIEKKK